MIIIKQSKIKSLKHLSFLEKWKKICLWITLSHIDSQRIDKLWLWKINDNVLFLPPAIWSISRYNAEWKKEKLKNLPKETYYIERYWTRHQRIWWWKTEKHSKITYSSHKRYQVNNIPPLGIELRKLSSWIYWPIFTIGKDDEKILHAINLFLELFWECEILSEDLEPLIKTWACTRYNWEFIKPWDWDNLKRNISSIIEKKSNEQKYIIMRRINVAEKLWLNCVWYWVLWFKWYIAFQSKNKKYTIFENINYGNAIYITDVDWIDFSKQDKQTILKDWNYIARIIHDKWRENKLTKYC